MNEAIRVRSAQSRDLIEILALYRQLQPDDPVLDPIVARPLFEDILASAWLRILVGEYNGQVLTTCYLNTVPNLTRGMRPYAVIENVVTSSDHRGMGMGKATMRAALKAAWDQGCYKVMLQTGSMRDATHGFYRSCGFSDEKTGYVARPPA